MIERLETFREEPARNAENSVQLKVRLLIKPDVVNLVKVDGGVSQAPPDRIYRKRCVMLYPRESLFLCSRHNLSVPEQARRGVVVVSRNAENVHVRKRLSIWMVCPWVANMSPRDRQTGPIGSMSERKGNALSNDLKAPCKSIERVIGIRAKYRHLLGRLGREHFRIAQSQNQQIDARK